jgi:hypothetical protein
LNSEDGRTNLFDRIIGLQDVIAADDFPGSTPETAFITDSDARAVIRGRNECDQ